MRWNKSVPTRTELRDAKREAVLREAALSFNRRGFHGTSLDEVAQKLGITKAAIYYYFPNKQTLLKACFESAMDAAFSNLDRARKEGTSGREKLRMTLAGYLEHIIDELSISVVAMEDDVLATDERDAVKRRRDQFEYAMRDLVREGIQDGSIVPCDPKLAVFALLGAVHWVTRWFRQNGSWSTSQLAAALSELLDRALSTHPTPELTRDVALARVPKKRRVTNAAIPSA